ncbi:MAG: hypothetical protein FJ304_24520 [Planctomycetes bacterium]|nr:hypothetical protein [Planctomycetota bacterium]
MSRPRVNYKYAKAEQTRHPAHHTVASFPLEFALRHLANDGSAAPELRDTAKHVLTTGDVNGLWALDSRPSATGSATAPGRRRAAS